MLTPWLAQVWCQELQKAPGATTDSWVASSLCLLLLLGLADLNVTAPANSNVVDFVPVVVASAGGTSGRRAVCVTDLWWWLTVTRVLPGQGNSCAGSGCLHRLLPVPLGAGDGLCEPSHGSGHPWTPVPARDVEL